MSISRRGLLTHTSCIEIETWQRVLNHEMFIQDLPHINAIDLHYTSMLQAGIDCIELPSTEENRHKISPFLKKHLAYRSPKEWVEALFLVVDFLEAYVPRFREDKRLYTELFPLSSFLVDVLAALASQRNLLTLHEMPNIANLADKLPPDVFLPINNLLKTFEIVTPNSVCPRISIDRDNVSLFQEIIASRLFEDYESAHSSLDDERIPIRRSSEYITKSAYLVCRRNIKWVKGRKILIALLPFSSRVVDLIFGSLPGKLAEHFARLTQDWLNRNQRLVIYQLHHLRSELLKGRIDAWKQARKEQQPPDIHA